jgi:hypothetical protein
LASLPESWDTFVTALGAGEHALSINSAVDLLFKEADRRSTRRASAMAAQSALAAQASQALSKPFNSRANWAREQAATGIPVTVSSRPYLLPLSVGSPTSPHTPQTDHGTTSYDTRQPLFPRHRHITLLWLLSLLLSALGLTISHAVHPHGYYASSQGIT